MRHRLLLSFVIFAVACCPLLLTVTTPAAPRRRGGSREGRHGTYAAPGGRASGLQRILEQSAAEFRRRRRSGTARFPQPGRFGVV